MSIREVDYENLDVGATVEQIKRLVTRIRPILAGNDPVVIGAALCELQSILFAGIYIPGKPGPTCALRKELIDRHNARLWELIAINAKELGTP